LETDWQHAHALVMHAAAMPKQLEFCARNACMGMNGMNGTVMLPMQCG